jgi:hypothetical protein
MAPEAADAASFREPHAKLPERRTPWAVRHPAAIALDAAIVIYAIGLALVLTIGGIDLGIVSVTQVAKPLLVLFIAIPVRVALGGESWLTRLGRAIDPRALFAGAVAWLDRVPPAIRDVAFVLVATRTATFAIGFLANVIFRPSRDGSFTLPFKETRVMETFAAWDSGWYFDIASRGYYFNADGQSSVAFFPLYPMLMRLVAWPFGGGDRAIWMAGIAVSSISFALALVALHRFTERTFGDREVARRTVLYVAIFPFSLFFTKVYAESLFLLTSIVAVASAYEDRWWRAGVWGALAALTRPNGILVLVPLALLAVRGRPPVKSVAIRCAALLPVPLALAGHCAYVYALSGDPLAWLSAQAHWGYSLGHPPWEQLLKMLGRIEKYGMYDYFFISKMTPFRLFHGVSALIFLVLTPAIFKRLGAAMGAYVLASLLVPLSGNALEGIGRYSAVLFPAFMIAGTVKSPRVHEALLIVASLFLALFISLFVTLYPIY